MKLQIVVVVLTLTRMIKSVVTGQAQVTKEWRDTPIKKSQTNQKWYTHWTRPIPGINS